LLSVGVTASADMGTSLDDWQTFRRMGDLGALRMRIMSYAAGVRYCAGHGGDRPYALAVRRQAADGRDQADGPTARSARAGAWLKAPYADAPGVTGLPFLTDAQLLNSISRGAMDHFQIAIHAIGDRGNKQVLDSIDEVADTFNGDRRWRIEHAQIIDPARSAAFAKHGIIASMQPVHQTSDRTMAEARLGQERLAGAYAWKSMLANNVRLAFGSDYPVESPIPVRGLGGRVHPAGRAGPAVRRMAVPKRR
jgi:predicted amidohydrolase YtcJ